jgi:hypothetical protein
MDKEQQAKRAEQLLADPIILGFLETLEAQLVAGLKAAPSRDQDGIYRIAIMMQVAEKFKEHLNAYIADGKIAAVEAEQKKKGIFNIF